MDNQKKKRNNGLIIFICIIAGLVILSVAANFLDFGNYIDIPFVSSKSQQVIYEDYIAQLDVQGAIYEGNSGGGYDHEWTINEIDALIDDDNNKGILLYIDSPGGAVYVGDELYLKLLKYKEETGRPVYAYFSSQAASGAYYISCAADKIICNRNCITGSIGVKIGTFYDLTGLLEKYGVDAFDIASGNHKNMGSYFETMDEEELAIYQGVVDEAYEQFVGVVSIGRGLNKDTVRSLADGRIYTAHQAMELGLVDEIGGYDDAVDIMLGDLNADWDVVEFKPDYDYSLFDILYLLSSSANGKGKEGNAGDKALLFLSDGAKLLFEK